MNKSPLRGLAIDDIKKGKGNKARKKEYCNVQVFKEVENLPF